MLFFLILVTKTSIYNTLGIKIDINLDVFDNILKLKEIKGFR